SVEAAPVATLGPQIERHPRFPKRVNAGFLEIVARGEVRLRVYERGAGETPGCGTGACAAVAVGRRRGLLDAQVRVSVRGGELREKQAAVENKLAELVRVARANDAISERLHRFTRRLLGAVPREQAVARIEAGLREDFDAFHAALVLIGEPSAPAASPRFVR